MNIINKNMEAASDPFAQSDRNHKFRKGPGKGDANRSLTKAFYDNFPATMGRTRTIGKFRKSY